MSITRKTGTSTVDLSVIIVSWNVRDLLRACLKSVKEQTHQYSYEIWVVDNNSNDGTIDMIRNEFPDVHIIANQENRGFARANNQAFAQCNGRYVALLNPDTRLLNDAFDDLIDFLEQSPSYGAAGPRLIGADGHVQAACARYMPTNLTDLARALGLRSLIRRVDYGIDANVAVISGACMVLRREALFGFLLSEAYFMYGEDAELCWRLRHSGFQIRYLHDPRVLHIGGASSSQTTGLMHEEAYSVFRLRRHTTGTLSASLFRLIKIVHVILRLPIGIYYWFKMPAESSRKHYLINHLRVLAWAVGMHRNLGSDR